MVSESGDAEVTGFEALLRWDGQAEELLVSVAYTSADPEFAWLMPLPSAPEVEEGDASLIEEAFAITAPPAVQAGDKGEGAGAPPVVGGAPGVDVIGRDTVGDLRFVTLGSRSAAEVTRWMRKHGFGFHDRQEPVLQSYLDRGWVVVAARVAPGEQLTAALVPVRFSFAAEEPTYPLAMAGAGHQDLALGITLFVLSPFRPMSTTYPEILVRPEATSGFERAGPKLELRYSAQLDDQARRMNATPDTWLTRYEGNMPVKRLDRDLVFSAAAVQEPVVYSDPGEGILIRTLLMGLGVVLLAAMLAIWISLWMAKRRRSSEAPRMPGTGPGA
jgi:hypothetical protein